MTKSIGYIATDQYGNTIRLKEHPRKELLEKLGASNARKVYQDHRDGTTSHVGYIVNGLWFTVEVVQPWEGKK